ncbi:MarR family 2-MHQ and catechol resistance regulon transcriptional repressor [Bacillus sp. SORGH_AS 510]|uniref:MarR family winged helix-turn-helix transcriptional regulator n=1 Tax=Bacillus sp. SORGH_AS_0510 TaxID=3041771 RepID=UPI0027873769|nr:MarR family transcriptional regulator [Bacillus sp. SORGH_AS_0510]MDQ1144076.1 MarR family 2-MHQ and catechol resistance regulon transcriptional repressor [Bacillus sp. SORGH_AS_0510]
MERKCTNVPFLTLMQTSKAIHEKIKAEMAQYKLTITEFSVLEVLYLKGKQTIQQIGHCILISSGSMTYVIDKLEERGLLCRNACPEDRRMIHVTLKDQGTALMNEIMPKHQELVHQMFEALPSEEAETLAQQLKKINV